VPGHEIVGTVDALGEGVESFAPASGSACPGSAGPAASAPTAARAARTSATRRVHRLPDRRRLCRVRLADARYCLSLPEGYSDAEAAPLLCAGLIGYRAYRMAGDARRLGIYGFGAAAHIVPGGPWEGREVFAFTRPGDDEAQDFARELGAAWAGGSGERPPEPLDAAILFAPVGALVPAALRRPRAAAPWSAPAST
jgi:alcohol dehydrogenase, propanol-preferring